MTTLVIDHLILATANIDITAARLESDYGLISLPGGRHDGHGTGNRIVPIGDSYIEIMGIVDEAEAAASPMGAWLRQQTRKGDCIAGLCLRAESARFDAICDRLDLRFLLMSRDAPNGITLHWRLAGLAETMSDPSRTFFIDWAVPPEQHPSRSFAPHRIEPVGFSWVELSGDPDDIQKWIGEKVGGLRIAAANPPGIRAAIALANGGEVLLG